MLDLLHRSQNALIEVFIGAKEREGERDRKGRRGGRKRATNNKLNEINMYLFVKCNKQIKLGRFGQTA